MATIAEKSSQFLVWKLYNLWSDTKDNNNTLYPFLNSSKDMLVDQTNPIHVVNTNHINGHFINSNIFLVSFLTDERGNIYYSLGLYHVENNEFNVSFQKALTSSEFISSLTHNSNISKNKHIITMDNDINKWETYTGIENMAYIWSMKSLPGHRFGLRYAHRDVTKPMVIDIMIGRCFKQNDSSVIFERLNSCSYNRFYFDELKTIRKPIQLENGVCGTLFIPKESKKNPNKQYPAVIDLFGTAGGIMEFRAALLSSYDFITLSLPYFAYKNLPESFYGLELDYFEKAIDWLSNLNNVDSKNGIGLCGVSYGGELSLEIASILPSKVGAVVAISTSDVNTNFDLTYKGNKLPCVFPKYDILQKIKFEDKRGEFESNDGTNVHSIIDGMSSCADLVIDDLPNETLNAKIKVENMNASLLLVSGEHDANWPAHKFSRQIMERLDEHKYPFPNYHNCYYEAGHLIEPPYAPFCSYSFHKLLGGAVLWGGKGSFHNKAQEHSWEDIIYFFKKSLLNSSKI